MLPPPPASRPFHLFFLSGAVWSVIGVSLWPLYLWGQLDFYPNYCHARLMIEGFGGAFAVGILGAASGVKWARWEWLALLGLHEANAVCHLLLRHAWGDLLFAVMLLAFLARMAWQRKVGWLPIMGLVCGSAGALMALLPGTVMSPQSLRLPGLLLNQGMLLPILVSLGFGKRNAGRHPRLAPALAALSVAGSLLIEGLFPPQHIALEHLVYIGGIGVMLLVSARPVAFMGWLVFAGVLAAATRMIPGFLPQLTFSHYQYAALLWASVIALWYFRGRRKGDQAAKGTS